MTWFVFPDVSKGPSDKASRKTRILNYPAVETSHPGVVTVVTCRLTEERTDGETQKNKQPRQTCKRIFMVSTATESEKVITLPLHKFSGSYSVVLCKCWSSMGFYTLQCAVHRRQYPCLPAIISLLDQTISFGIMDTDSSVSRGESGSPSNNNVPSVQQKPSGLEFR